LLAWLWLAGLGLLLLLLSLDLWEVGLHPPDDLRIFERGEDRIEKLGGRIRHQVLELEVGSQSVVLLHHWHALVLLLLLS